MQYERFEFPDLLAEEEQRQSDEAHHFELELQLKISDAVGLLTANGWTVVPPHIKVKMN